MKKFVLIAALLVALILGGASWIIKDSTVVSSVTKVPVSTDAVFRKLLETNHWKEWWPEKKVDTTSGTLTCNGYQFTLIKPLYYGFQLLVKKDDQTDTLQLQLIPGGTDTTTFAWSTTLSTGGNPFQKINRYFKASNLKSAVSSIAASLVNYSNATSNLYGIDIKKELVTIGFMVTLQQTYNHAPSTQDVYQQINTVKGFVYNNQGIEEGNPMLHIVKVDSTHYTAQVAVPIREKLAPKDSFDVKAMFRGGNILSATITGGPFTIQQAQRQLNQYVADYQKTVMAIPFEMLVTDRSKEADTSKWITQLYCPIQH